MESTFKSQTFGWDSSLNDALPNPLTGIYFKTKGPLATHAHLRFHEAIGQGLPKTVKYLKSLMGLFE